MGSQFLNRLALSQHFAQPPVGRPSHNVCSTTGKQCKEMPHKKGRCRTSCWQFGSGKTSRLPCPRWVITLTSSESLDVGVLERLGVSCSERSYFTGSCWKGRGSIQKWCRRRDRCSTRITFTINPRTHNANYTLVHTS